MDINHLYGKNIKKKITLINILYNKHDWITTDELAKQAKLERKTVLKYIAELEKDIALFDHSKIYISFSKGRGTILNADNPIIVKKFILWLIKENIAIKTVHTLFFENSLNITKWSYENYVSVSTVRRTINELKKTFKPLNVNITSKKSTYYISGEEKDIRYMFYEFFWNTYKGIHWPFKNISKNKLNNLLNDISSIYSTSFSIQGEEQLSFFMAVNITRYFQNHHICLEEFDSNYQIINLNIINNSKINDIIKKYFLISDSEIQFWLFYFQTKGSFYSRFIKDKDILALHQKYHTESYQYFQIFKDKFTEYFDLDMNSLSEIDKRRFETSAFSIHYKISVFPKVNKNPIEKDYTSESLYPQLLKHIENFMTVMYEETKNCIFLNNPFLRKKYSLLYEIFRPLYFLEKKISIYFEADQPSMIRWSIKKHLESIINIYFNVSIYSIEELENYKISYEDIDLVISTIPTNTQSHKFQNSSFIYLNYKNRFTSYDIQLIYRELQNLVSKKMQNINELYTIKE
ncbi:hypothetical protein UA3_02460 [Enterococcus faecium EnGen0263]|uniref:helix-turn-helix domain-containing protein n=1 Tax=Enterococcus faecium TaxID=1352 RepID=UPI0003310663|nr:helix-turn-helix domain-containing protein [Enterococcus faecium]EOH52932.1 hypothetical protein UA3_02460 [Enterococcus faecium EnGen0263]